MRFLSRVVAGVKRAAQAVQGKVAAIMGAVGAAVVIGFSALPGAAQAALPTGVDTALTSIQTDAQSLAALVAPVMLAILGLVVTFKLIKRFTNKV